jgi:agmatinase
MVEFHPWGDLLATELDAAGVCILGLPFDLAVSCGKGAARAPERIRRLSRYFPPTTETGLFIDRIKVYDAGDVPPDPDWENYFKAVEDKAFELMATNKFCLFLGGDHSVTIPLHRAFGRCREAARARAGTAGKYGIIHFDAHCDLCDTYDGKCWSHACTERRSLEGVIGPGDLTLLGIRSYEAEEPGFLKAHPEIKIIHALDIYNYGIIEAYREIEKRYRDYSAIYFTLDIDVLDPAFAPGTGTPEPGGLSSRELMELVKLIMTNLPVKAMDIVEVSPVLDHSDITTWAALKIIYEVFGCLNNKQALPVAAAIAPTVPEG